MGSKKISLILIFFIAILSFATYTLATTEPFIKYNEKYVEVVVSDDTISKEEAERRNLSNITKEPVPTENLQFFNFASENYTYPSSTIIEEFAEFGVENIEINPLYDSENLPLITKKSGVPITQKMIDQIVEKLDENDISIVVIHDSFLEVSNESYVDMLSQLRTKSYQIIAVTPALWGSEVDYTPFFRTNAAYIQFINIGEISNYADKIIVKNYGYTHENSVLAGPIAPLDWFENVLQFYIQQGVPRSKIVVGLNTFGYRWSDAELVYSYLENYNVFDPVAKSLNYNELKELGGSLDESIYEYVWMSENQIWVYPTQQTIQNRIDLSAEYGVGGVAFF